MFNRRSDSFQTLCRVVAFVFGLQSTSLYGFMPMPNSPIPSNIERFVNRTFGVPDAHADPVGSPAPAPVLSVSARVTPVILSAVQDHKATITYTVFNNSNAVVQEALLAVTLAPGVFYLNANPSIDRSGGELRSSLGTISPFGSASLEVQVAFGDPIPLILDDGAHASANQAALHVSAQTGAAQLRDLNVDPALLAATIDADSNDPYIVAKAAQLGNDPLVMFHFVRDEIGYESYSGSLRGARGTLWSQSGNSLDKTSLLIALLRASGIPSQYVKGQLDTPTAQQLILSMFPPYFRVAGFTAPGVQLADPANDAKLLSETKDHYWVEFDADGSGFQALDPTIPGSAVGQTFTSWTESFTEVPEELRHKVSFRLKAETTTPSLFGGSFQNLNTVLEHSYSAVELVGRPIHFGQLVSATDTSAVVVSLKTYTYSPYMIVNQGDNDPGDDDLIRGTDVQEVLTNFPFGSQILTGMFLEMDAVAPGGDTQTFSRTIKDRIGYAIRQNGGVPNIGSADVPALSPFDVVTVNVSTGRQPQNIYTRRLAAFQKVNSALAALKPQVDAMNALNLPTLTPEQSALTQSANILETTTFQLTSALITERFLQYSDIATRTTEAGFASRIYVDSPRFTIASHLTSIDVQGGNVDIKTQTQLDLRKDNMRAVLRPGQAQAALPLLNQSLGFAENGAETYAIKLTPGSTPLSTFEVLRVARETNVPTIALTSANAQLLDPLPLSAEAKARISDAIHSGKFVLVPQAMVQLGSGPTAVTTVGWYETDVNTGETIGVMEDGSHGITDYAEVQALFAYIENHFLEIIAKAQGVMIGFGLTLTIGGLEIMALRASGADKQDIHDFVDGLIAAAGFGFGGMGVGGFIGGQIIGQFFQSIAEFIALLQNSGLPLIAFGYVTGIMTGVGFAAQVLKAATAGDPKVLALLATSGGIGAPDSVDKVVPVTATLSGGSISGNQANDYNRISGDLSLSFSGSDSVLLSLRSLSVPGATVRDEFGGIVGNGDVVLPNGGTVDASFNGVDPLSISGNGTLSFYGNIVSPLGVSGDWNNFTGSFGPSAGSLVFTSDRLIVGGNQLPFGRYTVEITSFTFSGSGASTTPNFNGSVSIGATNATVQVGRGNGAFDLHGSSLDSEQGFTLTGFNGNASIADISASEDSATYAGSAVDVIHLTPNPAFLFTDQNTEVTTELKVFTSHTGDYKLAARAPPGWKVEIDSSSVLHIQPAPGLQSGTYNILVSAKSQDDSNLVASTIVQVDIGGTAPGVSLEVIPDPTYTIPYGQTEIPTAFRAKFRNLGPAADDFIITVTQAPDFFTIDQSASQLTVPAGELAEVGLYLRPNAIGALPPVGAPISFEIQVTSQSDPGVTQTVPFTFFMPEVHAVRISSNPVNITVPPGGFGGEGGGNNVSQLVVDNIGNVLEDNIVVTTESSNGLQLSGFGYSSPLNLSLPVGGSHNASVAFVPDSGAALGSVLGANFNATYGPSGSEKTSQAFVLVNVSVPGVSDFNDAANAALGLGQSLLSNTLLFLGGTLMNLFQDPGNELFQSQAVAGLNSLLSQLTDPIFANQTNSLTNLLNVISQGLANEIPGAISGLNGALGSIVDSVSALQKHDFTITLLPNSQQSNGTTPSVFQVVILNQGTAPTTFFLAQFGLPAQVDREFSQESITLQPGEQSPPDLTLTVTQTGAVLTPVNFRVTAFVIDSDGNGLSKDASGSLTLRQESVQIAKVQPTPAPFVNPGADVTGVLTTVLSAVNSARTIRLNYVVKNSVGDTVVTSATPAEFTAQIDPTIQLPTIPGFSTVGLPEGDYTIEVFATETDDTPIPGATGVGQLFIGSPIEASLSVLPSRVTPGGSAVTTQLNLQRNGRLNPPVPLLGAATVVGNAFGIALKDDYAFVANGANIQRVNVADATAPVLDGTIGSGISAQALAISGNTLYWHGTSADQKHTRLGAFDITDPTAPVALGEITLEPWFAGGIEVIGSTVFASFQNFVFFVFGQDISSVSGNFVAVDFSNPANPIEKTRPYDETVDGATLGPIVHSSPHFLFEKVPVGPNHVYMATSSASGGDTLNGVGQIKVIDTSDVNNVHQIKVLDIPGTVNTISIQPQGTHALVLGTTEGINDPGFPSFFLRGHIMLTSLDVSDPANPTILSQVDVPSLTGNFGSYIEPMGGDRYLIGQRVKPTGTNDNVIMIVDASDPTHLTYFTKRLLEGLESYNFVVRDNKLYAVATNGFFIFDLNGVAPTTYRAEVQVIKNANTYYVPVTFNINPSQIVPGPGYDTLIWEDDVLQSHIGFDATSLTLSWTTQILNMGPVETRPVTQNSKVEFSVLGFPGEVDLLPAYVSSEIIVGLSPETQTVNPGQPADFVVNVRNPSSSFAQAFLVTVIGVPDSWVNINNGNNFIVVQGLGNENVPLRITPDTDAAQQEYKFIVLATPYGQAQQFSGSVHGSVVVQGDAVLPPVGPPDGVVVQLTPPNGIAGRTNPAKLIMRVTNTGTQTKTFDLFATTPNFDVTFSEASLTLLPGLSNFRDVQVELSPKVFAIPGDHTVALGAQLQGNPSVVDSDDATITLVDLGVQVSFDAPEVPPNSIVNLVVTNFGASTDTYNLALSGPVAPFAILDTDQVTLGVGETIFVPVTIGDVNIGLPGHIQLIGTAQSVTNSAIQSIAKTDVLLPSTNGFQAEFEPELRVLPAPGDAGFLLTVKNVGNSESTFQAQIIGSTNVVFAELANNSGARGSTLPVFRIPGLGQASVFLNGHQELNGTGTVTVRVTSPENESFQDVVATIEINGEDQCPGDPNKFFPGICGCGIPDTDSDGDGIANCQDACSVDPLKTTPGVCGCGVSDVDTDGDGTPNCNDQCASDPSKLLPGVCGCGVSDVDSDNDGTANCHDVCSSDPFKIIPGVCGCGISDADTDGDGTPNCNDSCPTDSSKLVPGACGCGVSDADTDGDGTPNCNDSCPADPSKIFAGVCGCGSPDSDTDHDGALDCVDQCPADASKLEPGVCGCGVSDADTDNDGTPNCHDQCPTDAAKTSPGECGCGVVETPGCATDLCPADPLKTAPGICGCGTPDVDSDLDGTFDCNDACPSDALKTAAGICGCGVSDIDGDSDGVPNCNDQCPSDPGKTVPGECGCGNVESPGCGDLCPADPLKTAPGVCGCGISDVDSDSDGTPNCNDSCVGDPNKTAPGICGCNVSDADSDSDGTTDCNDQCPADPSKVAPLVCGCGISEVDTDGDGTPDCIDTPEPVDVSALVTITPSNFRQSLNRATRVLTNIVTITIKNTSSQTISAPFVAKFALSAGGVTMPGASGGPGVPPYNTYYFDLAGLIPGVALDPGESVSFDATFVRNSTVQFTYSIIPIGIVGPSAT